LACGLTVGPFFVSGEMLSAGEALRGHSLEDRRWYVD
jgi:hypothetical protein